LNKCPRCDHYGLDYFSSARLAKCLLCDYTQQVDSRDEFFALFPNGRSTTNNGHAARMGEGGLPHDEKRPAANV
jgi:hypothetical protein